MMNYRDSLKNFPILKIQETDSTNNYLNELSRNKILKEFTTVTAYFQTAGRGQRGNGWESEPGENLLFSFIVYPEFLDIRKQFILSRIISLSIKKVLDHYVSDISIKWPNDIYRKDLKICGTLIENEFQGSIWKKSIAGIGININQLEFGKTTRNPVSLRQITGERHEINKILSGVMSCFMFYYEELRKGNTEDVITEYHNSLYRKDGFHLYRDANGEFMARTGRILPEGTLILIDENGNNREYAFKEVEYVL